MIRDIVLCLGLCLGFLVILAMPVSSPAGEPSRTPGLSAGAAVLPITPVDEKGRLWQEPYADLNGNGRYDAPDPLKPQKPFDSFTDLNGNGKWDGPFMAGFKHKKRYYVGTGVRDDLWARVLVLKVGDTTLALVALDLVGYLYPEVLKIRRAVADLKIDLVVVASTHTHAGLDSIGLWGPNPLTDGKDPRFMDYIWRQTVSAIRSAHKSLQPAHATWVQTRFPSDFGQAIRDKRDPIVIDDRLSALRVATEEGRTIAILVNGSPHPETLGDNASLVSSDFPHFLRTGLEKGGYAVDGKKIPGWGGTGIYFSGAVGGLMTTLGAEIRDESGQVLPQQSYDKTRRIGQLASRAVTRALEKASPTPILRMEILSRRLDLPLDNEYLRVLLEKGVLQRETYTSGKLSGTHGKDIRTEVNLIGFYGPEGPVAQMITVPGELFPEILLGGYLKDSGDCWGITDRKKEQGGTGRERLAAAHPGVSPEPVLRSHFKASVQFILGLANDELGYIVPANDFIFPRYTPGPEQGKDRCGDDDHYEETFSASSRMAPEVTRVLVEMLKRSDGSR